MARIGKQPLEHCHEILASYIREQKEVLEIFKSSEMRVGHRILSVQGMEPHLGLVVLQSLNAEKYVESRHFSHIT